MCSLHIATQLSEFITNNLATDTLMEINIVQQITTSFFNVQLKILCRRKLRLLWVNNAREIRFVFMHSLKMTKS